MKRKFSLASLFLIPLLALVWLLTPSKETRLKEGAFSALKEGQTLKAEALLIELKNRRSSCKVPLYFAHLEHQRGHFKNANQHLAKAALLTPQEQLEATLLRACNAFFLEDEETFFSLVPTAGSGALSTALLGLKAYLKQDFSNAYSLLNESLAAPAPAEKKQWSSLLLQTTVSPLFLKLVQGHALIELDRFEEGRALIETELHQMSAKTKAPLLAMGHFFLGLSYLKEGQNTPLPNRPALYALAHFYFDKVPHAHKRLFNKTVNHALFALQNELQTLFFHPSLPQDEEEVLLGCTLDFIALLKRWEAFSVLEGVATTYATNVVQQALIAPPPLCHALLQKEPLFATALNATLKQGLLDALNAGHFGNFFSLWTTIKHNALALGELEKEVVPTLVAHFPKVILQDGPDLVLTKQVLALYQELEPSQARLQRLSVALAATSKKLWQQRGAELKATALMQEALALIPLPALEGDIERFLHLLYAKAESANTRGRMCYILDALVALDMELPAAISQAKVKNTLADGKYLLATSQYLHAELSASWVLRVEPKNQEALSLLGLSFYHQGEYEKAFATLTQVSKPDAAVKQALHLCQTLTQEGSATHFATLDTPEK